MTITSHKTPPIKPGDDLLTILDANLPKLQENDIVVVTSKIISICQGRIVPNDGTVDKHTLIKQEADAYIEDPGLSQFGVTLTLTKNTLIANAGIDESNGNGNFVLWPNDPFGVSQQLWHHLRETHHIRHLGILITDSRLTPLRWGTIGVGLAWCGFEPLKNYIGTPDIFGKNLRMTKASHLDGLAAAAVLIMGEGNEQTPLCVIRDTKTVTFMDRPPTQPEIDSLKISLADDMYSPLTNSPRWITAS